MLLILSFLAIQGWISGASPVITSLKTLDIRDDEQCICPDTRSILDIVWSCLATTFLCTWVCIHPNLPPPKENRFKGALRRVHLMCWALFAPEMILMWSFRQWFFARKLTKAYEGRNWSMKHSFFVIMGGFVLYKGDEDMGTISYDLFVQLEKDDQIIFPTITSEEIKDKSKGDGLSKLVVIIQTAWFIIQCIARGAQGLAITELEISTMALCSLNAMIYLFWWHKPLDVECRIPVYLKPGSDYVFVSKLKRAEVIDNPVFYSSMVGEVLTHDAEKPSGNATGSPGTNNRQDLFGRLRCFTRRRLISFKDGDIYELYVLFKDAVQTDFREKNFIFILPLFFMRIFMLMATTCYYLLFLAVLLPSSHILLGIDKDDDFWVDQPNMTHLPTFYSPLQTDDDEDDAALAVCVFAVSAILFGGLHCIAWNFHFPTHAEQIIWRASSLFIASIPATVLLSFLFHLIDDCTGQEEGVGFYMFAGSLSLFTGLYPLVRLLLLVESFVLLRGLPPNVFLNVNWNNFIPHF